MIRVSKFKRSNGCWYLRYFLAGQLIRESAKTASEHDAETCRIRRELEMNAGIQPIRHANVDQLVKAYLITRARGSTRTGWRKLAETARWGRLYRCRSRCR
jgi:hypothetical protein